MGGALAPEYAATPKSKHAGCGDDTAQRWVRRRRRRRVGQKSLFSHLMVGRRVEVGNYLEWRERVTVTDVPPINVSGLVLFPVHLAHH